MIFCTLFLSLLICSSYIECNDKQSVCIADNTSHRYSRERNDIYSKYIDKIKKARSSYVPCNATVCGECYFEVIRNDLKAFEAGITRSLIEAVKTKGIKYQVIKGQLFRERVCMFPARCSGIEYFLSQLKSDLPDFEMIVNTRDWPQIPKNYGPFGPVFSFSKTNDYNDIMFPAWAFWEGGPAISLFPKGIGDWEKHRRQISLVANKTKWADKSDVAFFRGSRTSSERDTLVLLARDSPNLVNARYTKNQAWKSEADTLYLPPASEVSFIDHCKYKYLFNYRGVAASFRLKHILLCKSLVFHVGNEWLEFFYPALVPWIHYVPVQSDIDKNNLRFLIEFFRENEEYSQSIASEGFNLIWRYLRNADVMCYWKKLLNEYSALLKYRVTLDKDLIEIY